MCYPFKVAHLPVLGNKFHIWSMRYWRKLMMTVCCRTR